VVRGVRCSSFVAGEVAEKKWCAVCRHGYYFAAAAARRVHHAMVHTKMRAKSEAADAACASTRRVTTVWRRTAMFTSASVQMSAHRDMPGGRSRDSGVQRSLFNADEERWPPGAQTTVGEVAGGVVNAGGY